MPNHRNGSVGAVRKRSECSADQLYMRHETSAEVVLSGEAQSASGSVRSFAL
jgi:hypothetical protein